MIDNHMVFVLIIKKVYQNIQYSQRVETRLPIRRATLLL